MVNTKAQKVMMTISVDPVTRNLIHKYGGARGVGRLVSKLIKQHDTEETFGPTMISNRLDLIEKRITELLNGEENNMGS